MGKRRPRLVLIVAALVVVLIGADLVWRRPYALREKARRMHCASNLHGIGLACQMYASFDVEGRYFPADLALLATSKCMTDGDVYGCPSCRKPAVAAAQSDYVYVGDRVQNTGEELRLTILAHDRPGNHPDGWVNVLFADAHVAGIRLRAGEQVEDVAHRRGWRTECVPPPAATEEAIGPESSPSRQILAAAWQEVTRDWWGRRRVQFELYTSELVLTEASAGDAEAAAKRLAALDGMPILPVTEPVAALAQALLATDAIPEKANADAVHVAIAAVHGIDYLLTWNCTHIDNAETKPRVRSVCAVEGHRCPEICTPQELMGIDYGRDTE